MSVYGTCVLEAEVDAKFSLGFISNSFQGDNLPSKEAIFAGKR